MFGYWAASYVCVCVRAHTCIGGVQAGSRAMSLGPELREKESLEAYLDAVPDTGVQFLAPGCIAPLGAPPFRGLYCCECSLTLAVHSFLHLFICLFAFLAHISALESVDRLYKSKLRLKGFNEGAHLLPPTCFTEKCRN